MITLLQVISKTKVIEQITFQKCKLQKLFMIKKSLQNHSTQQNKNRLTIGSM